MAAALAAANPTSSFWRFPHSSTSTPPLLLSTWPRPLRPTTPTSSSSLAATPPSMNLEILRNRELKRERERESGQKCGRLLGGQFRRRAEVLEARLEVGVSSAQAPRMLCHFRLRCCAPACALARSCNTISGMPPLQACSEPATTSKWIMPLAVHALRVSWRRQACKRGRTGWKRKGELVCD